jgi:O-antigen ligase
MGFDSPVWLPILGVIAYVTAARSGIYGLLVVVMAWSLIFRYDLGFGGLRLDATDITIAAIAYLTFSGRDTRLKTMFWKLPGIRVWIFLGIALSFSYAFVPFTAVNVTGPGRAVYLLFRYCWRIPLLYPIAMVAALDHEQGSKLLRWLTLLGTIAALYSILHTLAGQGGHGFFGDKNTLAGALVAPAICALGTSISANRTKDRIGWIVCLGVIVLALLFAGSRGAVVAAVGGFACLALPMTRYAGSRRRLFRMAIAGTFVAVVALAALPSDAPIGKMDDLAELSQGTQVDNLQWRIERRWPHFWAKAIEHPWIGIGVDRDESLSDAANTPHNGYLSFLVRNGFPATIAWILLALRAAVTGLRTFSRRRLPTAARFVGLTAGAALCGILIHNIVDQTFVGHWVGEVFLILAGIAAASGTSAATPTTIDPKRSLAPLRRPRPPKIAPVRV